MNRRIPLFGATTGLSVCLIIAGFFLKSPPAPAFEPALPHLPLTLHLVIEVFELPRGKYNELVQQHPGVRNDERLLGKIRSLVSDKEARLMEHHSVNTRSGQRASVESSNEVIYATEFHEETAQPTAFTMRPCGFRAEVEPVIGPDCFTVDLNLSIEICEFSGMEKQHYTNPKTKKSFNVEQPRFYSRKIQTAVTSYDGTARLMGNFGAKGDPTGKSGQIDVVFVTPTLVN